MLCYLFDRVVAVQVYKLSGVTVYVHMGDLFLADVVCIIYGGKVPLNLPLAPAAGVFPSFLIPFVLIHPEPQVHQPDEHKATDNEPNAAQENRCKNCFHHSSPHSASAVFVSSLTIPKTSKGSASCLK